MPALTIPERLSSIQAALQADDYLVERSNVFTDIPAEQLYVPVAEDEMGRPYFMQLIFINDGGDESGASAEDVAFALLQFYISFPLELSSGALLEAGRLFHFVNQTLPLGFFGIMEVARRGSFRFVYPWQDIGERDLAVVREVFDMTAVAVSRLAPLYNAIGAGKISAEQAIDDISRTGVFAGSP